MGRFTRISEDAFDALQTNAGVLLTEFDPANPYVIPSSDSILATTTGGVNPVCSAEYSDYGEDVDNVPNNMMEFKQLTGWTCTMGFTTIKFNAENTVWALGAADKTLLANGVAVVKPRSNVKLSDYKTIWWVGDKANGGAYAIKLMNALSTGGMSVQSTKNGKGTNAVTLTGHVSIEAQDVVPMEFYDIPAPDEDVTVKVTQNLTNVTSTLTDTSAVFGNALSATLTAESGYRIDNVVVTMGGVDVTAEVYATASGEITIAAVTGDIVITATATEE